MLKSLFNSSINEETNKMLQWVQKSTQRNAHIEAIRTVEMNLFSRHKACIFYKGEGKSIVVYEIKFICMSRDKNKLHFYHSSTFSKVVAQR